MQSLRNAARMGFVVMGLGIALIAPAGVLANDGEIGNMGDTTSITDVFVSGGRAAVNIDYLRDCAGSSSGPIIDCWIEVRFYSRCPEFYCGWVAQPWSRIPATGAARADCMGSGNEDNEWYASYRTAYVGTKSQTVQWKGEIEYYTDIGGGVTYRLITEAMFNVSAGAGFSGGTVTETVTATSDYAPLVPRIASSGGRDLVTC